MTEIPTANRNQDPHDVPTRIATTMRAITLLIDHGEEAVEQQGQAEIKSLVGSIRREKEGVLLFNTVKKEIGVPVLARVYDQLDAVEARIAAKPEKQEGEGIIEYTFSIMSGVVLTEEQESFRDEDGENTFYSLYGQRVDTPNTSD